MASAIRATFNEKYYPAFLSGSLRHALLPLYLTVLTLILLHCLLLIHYLYLPLLIIPVLVVLVLSSSHFTLLAFLPLLLPIIREALVLLAVTLCLFARTHFCVHIFYNLTFALELVAQTLEVLLFPLISSRSQTLII